MTIHIIGRALLVGTKHRQLCAWCGEKLLDDDWSLIATHGGGGPLPWPEGELLSVHEHGKTVVQHKNGDPLPRECCAHERPALRLVEPMRIFDPGPSQRDSDPFAEVIKEADDALSRTLLTQALPTSDLQKLDAATAAIGQAKVHVNAVMYENGSYHSIKYNIDGALDLLLQAEMNIEHAAKKLASPIAAAEPETE